MATSTKQEVKGTWRSLTEIKGQGPGLADLMKASLQLLESQNEGYRVLTFEFGYYRTYKVQISGITNPEPGQKRPLLNIEGVLNYNGTAGGRHLTGRRVRITKYDYQSRTARAFEIFEEDKSETEES